jgi:DNA-binding CsgD family transcriptional regulator
MTGEMMPVFGDLPGELSIVDVINKLNKGTLEQESWLGGLAAMAQFVGADAAHFLLWDTEADSISILDSNGLSETASQDYTERYQHLDPARDAMRDAPIGKIYMDGMNGLSRAIPEAEFRQDFLRRNEISSYMTMMVDRREPFEWMVMCTRSWGRPFFEQYNVDALHSLLEPLHAVMNIRQRLKTLEFNQRCSLSALDRVSLPLLIVDDRGAVQMANTAGVQWMSRSDFPLSSPRAAEVLDLVREACGTVKNRPRTATLSVPGFGERPSILMAVPIICSAVLETSPTFRRVALLLELGTSSQAAASKDLLKQVFHLTPAEIALTAQLARGLTLADAAVESRISRETARSHLKSILHKTGTHRQSGLTALLAGMSQVNLKVSSLGRAT